MSHGLGNFPLSGNALSADTVAAAQTNSYQRAFWKASLLVALGLFEQTDAVRAANNNALLFWRTQTPASTASTQWQLWKLAKPQTIDEPDIRRGATDLLHRYRPNYQTVGQPLRAMPFVSSGSAAAEDFSTVRAQPDLHRYRTGFQTVGITWQMAWASTRPPDLEGFEPHRLKPDAHIFRVGYQTVGQSWLLWPQTKPAIEPEAYTAIRASLYWQRSAAMAATGGQPWFLWLVVSPRLEPETFDRHNNQDINQYRQAFQTVGQPLRAMPFVSGGSAAAETYEAPRAQPDLHRYRTGFQTVGQPYALLSWQSTRQRSEAESYESRRPSLYWQWSTALAPIGGQPWNLLYWQSARQRYDVEEYRLSARTSQWMWTTPVVISGPLVRAVAAGIYKGHYKNVGDVFQLDSISDLSDSTVDYFAGTSDSPVYGWMQVLTYSLNLLEQSQFLTGTVRDKPRRTVL